MRIPTVNDNKKPTERIRFRMNYRKDKYGNDISILGYGCMRFSRTAGKIDMEKTEKEIMTAFRSGVNYYDTAWGYHSGNSEIVMGKLLEKYRSIFP